MPRPKPRRLLEQARLLIEQAEALGEPPEDPLLLFSVLYGFWVANYVAFNGDVVRDLAAQFLALAEKQGATVPLMIGHRLMGISLLCHGGHRGRPSALRSGDRALRSCRASSAGDAIWPRRPGVSLILSVVGSVVAWLSRGRAHRRRARAQECARDRSSRHADVRVALWIIDRYPSAEITRQPLRTPMSLSRWRKKRAIVLEGARNDEPRLRIGPDRQGLGRDPNDDLRNHCISINGSNALDAILLGTFGEGPCGARAIR